jgi:NAD(P)-dependent dehydrogenase (short-subunit alcohol dehydrogenase family)
MDFAGKVALVTGGGNSIDGATSLAFAHDSAKGVVVDRDRAGAEATVGIIRQNRGRGDADVTNSEDVKAYVSTAVEK